MGLGVRCLTLRGHAIPPVQPRLRSAGRLFLACGLIAWVLPACQAPIAAPEPTPAPEDPVTDHEGPVLDTDPISAPQTLEQPILIEATASDLSGIYTVTLHYKPQNTDWQTLTMAPVDADGEYQVQLTRDLVSGAGSVSYYLEAADGTPYHNTSYSPTTGLESPYKFNLVTQE